jgi:VCBS repeat-containing protein
VAAVSAIALGPHATKGTVSLNGTTIAYDPNGQFDYLKAGETAFDHFRYEVSDGHGGSDDAEVTVTVAGVNDAPRAVADAGSASENETKSFDVLANDTDADAGDTKALVALGGVTVTSANGTVNGIDASSAFTIDGDEIKFTPGALFDALDFDDTATVVVEYTMADGQGATSSAALTLTVAGVNDAPALETGDSNFDVSETFTESNAPLSTTGRVVFSDVDTGDAPSATIKTQGVAGSGVTLTNAQITAIKAGFSITSASTGAWSFNLASPDYLPTGSQVVLTTTVKIDDGHGGAVDQDVTITINGTNDPATFGGADAGSVTEDAASNIATGTLAASDVDNTPNLFLVESGASPHGSWSIDSAGHWTYALNNGDPSVDALNNGATLPDSFNVHSTDGTAKIVSITINGATDPNVDHDTTDVNGNALVTSGPGFRSGSSHTFNGTPGADMIVGTNHAAGDIINAKAGNDGNIRPSWR